MVRFELIVFLVVGISTVFIDFSFYQILIKLLHANIELSKAISFLIGTVFAYFANRTWTFGRKLHASGSGYRFIFLYVFTLIINVVVNALSLYFVDLNAASVHFAFILATSLSAIINFLGMKYFVFKSEVILR